MFVVITVAVCCTILLICAAWMYKYSGKPPRRFAKPGQWYMAIIPSRAADSVDIVARREPLQAGEWPIERRITSIKLNDLHFEDKLDRACEKATLNIQELNSTIEVRTPQGVL